MNEENNKLSLFNNFGLLQAYEQAIDENIISSITDINGVIVHANNQFCEVSQYTPSEVIGQNHRIINSGHHSEIFFKDMWKTISRGNVWHNELMNKAKDGSIYWVDTVIVPIKNEFKIITHYLSLRTLITKRKELELENEEHMYLLEGLNTKLENLTISFLMILKLLFIKLGRLQTCF